jgi:phosphatidylinositol alpha-1,6-mannosyltransferase
LIAGHGEERTVLERLATSLGIADDVKFAGMVPEAELPAYYAASDLFVHPNRDDGNDFEGFGIVFLEAAAAGLAVIAGRSGGAPEAIAEGDTGALVSGNDSTELAREIELLLKNPDRRRAMGDSGRRRAIDHFSWQRAAEQVAAIDARIWAEAYGGLSIPEQNHVQ